MLTKRKKEDMKRIKAIIEKASDGGYGIYAEGDIPVFSGGLTEQEAKKEFKEMLGGMSVRAYVIHENGHSCDVIKGETW